MPEYGTVEWWHERREQALTEGKRVMVATICPKCERPIYPKGGETDDRPDSLAWDEIPWCPHETTTESALRDAAGVSDVVRQYAPWAHERQD